MPGKNLASTLAAVAYLAAGPASAALIDFTSDAFAAAGGRESYTTSVDGLTVTIDASPWGATLTHGDSGLGIDGFTRFDDPTVIDSIERLAISFDSAQLIEEVHVDLLSESGEVGYYRLDDGVLRRFDATAAIDGALVLEIGELSERIELIGFSWQVFGHPEAAPSDFTVAGLRTAGGVRPGTRPIPEPGSLAMFGLGGILVGIAVRRRD